MAEKKTIDEQDSFWAWVGWVTRTYFLRLLGINVVFLVCCIPVVTIPAALCGLHGVIQRFYRKQYAMAGTRLFFREFLTDFGKRTASFFLLLAPYAVVRITWGRLPTAVWYSMSALLLAAVILVANWFLPQLVFLNIGIKHALKNAFLLTALETGRNFGLIAIHTVCLTVLLMGLPITGFLLLLLPGLVAVLTTGLTMPVLRRYLVVSEESPGSTEE